ncbi:hypothetical protein SAMN05216355_10151 [Actinomyces ruminicola]|uniref:Uncharacterized protein n=1 Tax=Actinomyces ruminicola TaxID=332524 RepID=A0A1G9Z9X4_9ACTO|nr:hypothetical protein [Actinomyces ruminicola]SDN17416.1 hypothetical protein SAMN05216355_10151 [Actinomyces ruminicola]
MPCLLFAPGVGYPDSGGFPGGLQILARVLLDLAGFGFLLIALVFVVLNVYGAWSVRRRRRADCEEAGATSPRRTVALLPTDQPSSEAGAA